MANRKQLNLLLQGVDVWNQWRADQARDASPVTNGGFHYDAFLGKADLSGRDLRGANLGYVNLDEANLSGAHLEGASFVESEVANAIFTGAHLAGADLSDANLPGIDFRHADLRNANLSGAAIYESCLEGADLSGADLSFADLSDIDFTKVNLRGANIHGAYFSRRERRIARQMAMQAGAVDHAASAAYNYPWFSFRRKAVSQDMVLYPRTVSRFLLSIAVACFVLIASWIILNESKGSLQSLAGWIELISIFVVPLSAIVFVRWIIQLMRHIPLMVVDKEGIHYFFLPLFANNGIDGATQRDLFLKWEEISAIGIIKEGATDTFAIYAATRRWRSDWLPTLRIPPMLLPISAKQVAILIQMKYGAQIEANNIQCVELAATKE